MGYLNLNYRVFWSLFSSGFHIVQQTYQCFVTAHICIWVLGYWAILFLYNIVFVPSSFRLLYCPVNLPIFLLPNASYIFDHTTSYLLTPGLWSFFVTAHAMYLRAKKWATLFFSHLVFSLLLFRLQLYPILASWVTIFVHSIPVQIFIFNPIPGQGVGTAILKCGSGSKLLLCRS